MKKLFLASDAATTLELVRPLLPKPANEVQAAFIPTAGSLYENIDYLHEEKEVLEKLVGEVREIDLKTCQFADLTETMQQVDLVFIAGGNTFYLLDWVRKSGFDEIVQKRISEGLVYIGSSAGSILCCPTIEGAKRFDPPEAAPELTDYNGLNLVDFVIIPHAEQQKYRLRIDETAAELHTAGFEVVQLTNSQAVVVDGEKWEVSSASSSKF